jgi:hypothetical protein
MRPLISSIFDGFCLIFPNIDNLMLENLFGIFLIIKVFIIDYRRVCSGLLIELEGDREMGWVDGLFQSIGAGWEGREATIIYLAQISTK